MRGEGRREIKWPVCEGDGRNERGAEQSRQELPHAREQRREQCRGEEENDDERTRRTGLDVREVRRGKFRETGDVL